jgi:hypothetical protein
VNMSDELVKNLRSTYHATTPRKINTISAGQKVAHTVAPAVIYRNPDGPAAADEIERLTAEVKRLDHSTIHTCWDECPRVACAQRREIDALTAQLADARASERAADADLAHGTIADSDGDDGA